MNPTTKAPWVAHLGTVDNKRDKHISLIEWEYPVPYLESGYLVRVARLLVYMCPPTSMWTGAFDFVSWAGRGIPCVDIGDTGDRVKDSRDMLLPSWKQVNGKAIDIINYSGLRKSVSSTSAILSLIRSLPCLSARIFSLQIIATVLMKYVCIFSFNPGGQDRRMIITAPERGMLGVSL